MGSKSKHEAQPGDDNIILYLRQSALYRHEIHPVLQSGLDSCIVQYRLSVTANCDNESEL